MTTDRFLASPYHALILKFVGVILMVATLVDYVVLAVPPNFLNNEWLANLISEWVSRASVPLLGIAIVFLGVWFDRGSAEKGGSALKGLPQVTVILSALLGLLFLLMTPLYFNSSRLMSAEQTRQINQQAAQAEQQLNALLEQQRERVSTIVSNEAQLSQLQQQLDSLDLPEEQQADLKKIRETLNKVKSNPAALDQEVSTARTEGQKQIQERQKTALTELQSKMRRERLYTTLSSLVFSAGYLGIAWTGLMGTGTRISKPQTTKSRTTKPRR